MKKVFVGPRKGSVFDLVAAFMIIGVVTFVMNGRENIFAIYGQSFLDEVGLMLLLLIPYGFYVFGKDIRRLEANERHLESALNTIDDLTIRIQALERDEGVKAHH